MSVQTQYIKDKWKGKLAVFLYDDVTATLTTASLVSGTNFMDYGEIAGSSVMTTPSTQEFKNQNGEVVASDSTYTGNTEATVMQGSKEIADWNNFSVRGNRYVEYLYLGYRNAKQIESFRIVEVEPGMNFTAPGGTTSMKYKSTAIVKNTTVTLTGSQMSTMRTAIGLTTYPYLATTTTITASQEGVIIES
jgi:hypothetical protein